MSNFSEDTTSTFNQEPFHNVPLSECTSTQLDAKMKFLEKNNELLKSECEAMDLYLIKHKPELSEVIDVSWMPYDDLNKKKYKIMYNLPKIKQMNQQKSGTITTVNMFNVVRHLMAEKTITKYHMVFMMEMALMILNEDFNKYYNKLFKSYEQLLNEIENMEIERHETLQHKEKYKLEILQSGLTKDKLLAKYKRLTNKHLTSYDLTLNKLNLKTTAAVKEKKYLKKKLDELQDLKKNITEIDHMQAVVESEKLQEAIIDALKDEKKIKSIRKNVQCKYIMKRNNTENYEREIDLHALDYEIKNIKNRIPTTNERLATTESDDDLYQNYLATKETTSNLIQHYMDVKNYNCKSDILMETIKSKLKRQNEAIQFYRQKIDKYSKQKH